VGKIGSCCCDVDCIPLDKELLPTPTISGWTGGNWEGPACCPCMTFTPDSPTWSSQCSGLIGKIERTWEATWEHYHRELPLPKIICGDGTPSYSEDLCCPNPRFVTEEGASTFTQGIDYKTALFYKPSLIRVCLSQQPVDCGTGPELKWVLKSTYVFDYRYFLVEGVRVDGVRTSTNVGGDCFVLRDDPCTDEVSEGFAPDCDAIDPADSETWDDACLVSIGTSSFDRVKFLDDEPDGSYTFTNTDLQGSCTWETCDNDLNDATSHCFSLTSWPEECECLDCWCQTYMEFDFQTTEINSNTSTCCNSGCDFMGRPSTSFTNYLDCDIVISNCSVCPTPAPTCPDLIETYTCVDFEYESTCDQFVFCEGKWFDKMRSVYADDAPWINPGFPTCTGSNPLANEWCYIAKPCSPSDCDEDCCYFCKFGSEYCTCFSKYEYAGVEALTFDFTNTCELNSNSLCLNAPTWGVTFS